MSGSLRCSEVSLCCPRSTLGGGTAPRMAVCLVKSQQHGGLSLFLPCSFSLSSLTKQSNTLKEWCKYEKKRKKVPTGDMQDTLSLPDSLTESRAEELVVWPSVSREQERKRERREERRGRKATEASFTKMKEEADKTSKTQIRFCLLFLGSSSEVPRARAICLWMERRACWRWTETVSTGNGRSGLRLTLP